MKLWWLASAVAVAVLAILLGLHTSRARLGEPELPGSCGQAEVGAMVRLSYDLYHAADGTPVADGHGTLEFEVGRGDVFPAVDANVRGLGVGEMKNFPFVGDAGFGERNADWVVEYDRSYFGDLAVGTPVTVQGSTAIVVALMENSVRLDFNHPLAGTNLTMTVTVMECRPRSVPAVRVETRVPGHGRATPQEGENVSIHCEGAFAETGEVFFSSKDSATPFVFQVGAGTVIPGLDSGVRRMSEASAITGLRRRHCFWISCTCFGALEFQKTPPVATKPKAPTPEHLESQNPRCHAPKPRSFKVGEQARLHIPSDLAYGQKSDRVKVAVPKDVVFDVELLEIQR
ncbi:unnamed protein product [Symbiodinium natans]|uniref:peptidylprolyl isomerase n=1 Tax=Symbiodinium natans TaxID=878477 RepID=A0A812TW32_9DINO|nr:unnamed protein product [Symbiodinium natans]